MKGDLVLIKDETTFNTNRPLASVVYVYPGEDGFVRVASVKTEWGLFKRPVSKLVMLLPEDEDNSTGVSSGRSMSEACR